MKSDFIAMYFGLFLNRIRLNNLPVKLLKRLFCRTRFRGFFSRLDFLLTYGDKVKWLGSDVFLETRFKVPFHFSSVDLASMHNYFSTKDKIDFFSKGDRIYAGMKGLTFWLPFPRGILELNSIFLEDCYGDLDVEGKTVLDIGAFIGDSAVYFASKGAKRVVAYEPVPLLYKIAKENIQLNNFEDIVEMVNAAVSDNEGIVTINYDERLPGESTICEFNNRENKTKPATFKAKAVSFKSAVSQLGHVDLLKMDCEGAEWRIMPKAVTEDTLSAVDDIIMEIHGGSLGRMVSLLEKARFKAVCRIYGKNEWIVMATRKVNAPWCTAPAKPYKSLKSRLR